MRITSALVIVATLTSCDSQPSDPRLELGWVTNCTGPAFAKFGNSPPGPDRPVFRITDQLVLAVPKQNRPEASPLEHMPDKCIKVSDLPKTGGLVFVIQGNWSAGYSLADIPTVEGNKKQFRPDLVLVRVQPEPPSKLSAQGQREVERWVQKNLQNDYLPWRDAGGLACRIAKVGGDVYCLGHRTDGELDVTKVTDRRYSYTRFVLLQADYVSAHYGRIHVFWQVWTSDVAHGLDIDRAVWDVLAKWNLLN